MIQQQQLQQLWQHVENSDKTNGECTCPFACWFFGSAHLLLNTLFLFMFHRNDILNCIYFHFP